VPPPSEAIRTPIPRRAENNSAARRVDERFEAVPIVVAARFAPVRLGADDREGHRRGERSGEDTEAKEGVASRRRQ
jgi:hypothetical protein